MIAAAVAVHGTKGRLSKCRRFGEEDIGGGVVGFAISTALFVVRAPRAPPFSLRACRVPCQEQESPTCPPDRPSKILLVQVGTLSSSHPSFGVSVFFLSLPSPSR